ATKKIGPKDAVKTRVRSKPKTSSSNESNTDTSKKSDPNFPRKSRTIEHRGDGDRGSKSLQNSLTRTQPIRNTIKPSVGSSQVKTVKQVSSTSKSSPLNALSSQSLMKKSTTSKIRPENITKSSDDNTVKKRKSREQVGYSEKRDQSTIYMPKSTADQLNIKKSNEKIAIRAKDKEKSQDHSASNRTKLQMSSRERRKSRTLSPSEIRMLHSAIRRPDIVEKEQKKDVLTDSHSGIQADSNEVDYDYEDDFEDYESDFQECTDSDTPSISENSDSSGNSSHLEPIELRLREKKSTEHTKVEEEHMLDSGHYDLAEAKKRAAQVESMLLTQSNTPPLPELREPVGKTFSDDRPAENKSLPSSTDEGFEDSRSGDFTRSPPLSQVPFIDFRKPKENHREENSRKIRSRGEELLEMIKLDFMEWSLLECNPIPYDEFIRNYGKLNTQQNCIMVFTQTGDDNMDIEIQTDEMPCKNKWTQFPITCRKELHDKRDINLFKMEQLGVGNDLDEMDDINFLSRPSYDVLRLNDFLNRAGAVVLSLLEERKHGGTVFQNDVGDLAFSDGFVKLSVDTVTFLATRSVKIIHYSNVLNKVLLTIHVPVEEELETISKQDYITDCCIGCVWNISEPSMPKKLFYSQCPITACCFHLTNCNTVFAGLEDGSLSLWDLKEDEMWHQKITDKANELDWVIRTPTYTTTAELDAHTSQVVAIRVLSKIETICAKERSNKFIPIQICSLDEDGCLIIWSILHNMGMNIDDLGLSHWGNIRLIKNQKMFLTKKNSEIMNMFVDMHVDSANTNNIYIATNSTDVLHATYIGNRTNPLTYKPAEISKCGTSTCIDVCPFGQSFFWVGCNDGTIRLHYLNIERPIVQLKNEQYSDEIKALQWSKTKPLTIYTLDNSSRIHVWDLSKSDICPIHTLPMGKWGKISSMQLSPCIIDQDMTNQYLVKKAAIAAYDDLTKGCCSLDAVERAICHMERKKYFNCAYGGSLDANGEVVMDAAIMANNLRIGCVGAVRNIAHPITLAKMVLEQTEHVLIVEAGAQKFSLESGIPTLSSGQLIVMSDSKTSLHEEENNEDTRKTLLEQELLDDGDKQSDKEECIPGCVIERDKEESAILEVAEIDESLEIEPDFIQLGAVGAVAYDRKKRLASGTSTAGESGKLHGIVSATGTAIGCGIYVDKCGSVSVSGCDKTIYKYAPAQRILRRLRRKAMSIDEAVTEVLKDFEEEIGGSFPPESDVGVIALTAKGIPLVSFKCPHFPWAYCDKGYVYYGCARNEIFSEKIDIIERPLDCMCEDSN
ncbi:WD repeat-containing protein 60, partial [Trachymyrmex septentrionalis]